MVPKSAPNISLNLHNGVYSGELYIGAITGILVQTGVLTIAYYASAHFMPTTDGDSDSGFQSLMLPGTTLLVFGMLLCSAVIEGSTTEMVWVKNGEGELKAWVLWLQKSHVVNEQTFDSCLLFAKGPREWILTSRRAADGRNVSDRACQLPASPTGPTNSRRIGSSAWFGTVLKRMEGKKAELATEVGVTFSLSGVVCQFMALSMADWRVSVAQLSAIILMTCVRAWIRRRLAIGPTPKVVLDGHEMDWFALWISRCRKLGDTNLCNSWPTEYAQVSGDGESHELQYVLKWEIPTRFPSLAYHGVWGHTESNAVEEPLKIRQHLGTLVHWTSVASRPSVAVASSIEAIMNRLFRSPGELSTFCWFMEVRVDGDPEKIHFEVRYEANEWKANSAAIESALSLWLFRIRKKEAEDKEARGNETEYDSRPDRDWLREDEDLAREYVRILGRESKDLRRDMRWWIPDGAAEPLPPLGGVDQSDGRFHLGCTGFEEYGAGGLDSTQPG